jgi:hypothetical protein
LAPLSGLENTRQNCYAIEKHLQRTIIVSCRDVENRLGAASTGYGGYFRQAVQLDKSSFQLFRYLDEENSWLAIACQFVILDASFVPII